MKYQGFPELGFFLWTRRIKSLICLLYVCFFLGDVAVARENLIDLFYGVSDQNITVWAWIVCVVNNMANVAYCSGQLVIIFLCVCLAVCFKRIRQKFAAKEFEERLTFSLKILLDTHSALCDTMERFSEKISTLLLLYTWKDVLWMINRIFNIKTKKFSVGAEFYLAYAAVACIPSILRMATLVHSSDQVRQHTDEIFILIMLDL